MGALSAAWALRIGSYLYERVQRLGHDARFDKLKKDPMTWRIPWLFQSVWCFSLQAPLARVAAAGAAAPRLTRMDAIGAAVFVGGLAIETLADVQKDAFKRREPNAPMTEGLFQYSVYANYFGELTLWWGQALLAAPAATSATRVAAAVAAPVVDSLIIWRLSGVPMSEKSVWKKYGASAAYQDYRARTSLFFPLPPASVASPQALAWAKARAAKAVEGAKAQ
jgi:steroid 5-alpha reductase family enzyme